MGGGRTEWVEAGRAIHLKCLISTTLKCFGCSMHYAFSEKEGQKCSTLNSCFSTDFRRKIVKFGTNLSEHLTNIRIIFLREENKKKLLGSVSSCQDFS